MSGSEIVLFLVGFMMGAVAIGLAFWFRSRDTEKAQEVLQQQMELLAHRIFDEKTRRFEDLSSKSLTSLIDPLKERLKDFEQKVEQAYSVERSERGVLKGELNKLLELNNVMAQEAQNLSRALKGDVKTQGNWGEMILENILERSGLREGEEFISQGTGAGLKSEEGGRLLPDIIVRIPGGRHLVVDSKVSLKAYEAYCNGDCEEERTRFAKMHIQSLENHLNGLSSKSYHLADGLLTPDFVLLFMPLEPAFALAFKEKPEIFQNAWEKNIAIVSPTTLLTTLRTVAALWKQEKQQKNAYEIARRGGLLYEKFASLLNDLKILGDRLDSSQKAYSEVIKKMHEGRGNLMNQVEDLKELGAKTEKQLPTIT